MGKVKAFELRRDLKSNEQLLKQLEDLKNELAQLQVAKVCGGAASKLAKIKILRKSIAAVLTVYNSNCRAEVRKKYSTSKYLPKDLRVKGTRSWRRRLSKEDSQLKTTKEYKKLRYFPRRKYAIKD